MDILIITVLIIAAVITILVELFVIPGLAWLAFQHLLVFSMPTITLSPIWVWQEDLSLRDIAVACIGSLIWFMRSKMLDKLALKKDIDSKVDRSAEKSVKVGDTGISTTRLAQIGYAEINGNIVEVRSIDGFLNEKTPIIVSRITDGTILVEKHKI